jgi:spore photoproduct lyase
MIKGLDGKMRYPRPLRVMMYQKIVDALQKAGSNIFLYFCMEPPWVWKQVFGKYPGSNAELDFWFAESIFTRFPEIEMDKPHLRFYPSDDS